MLPAVATSICDFILMEVTSCESLEHENKIHIWIRPKSPVVFWKRPIKVRDSKCSSDCVYSRDSANQAVLQPNNSLNVSVNSLPKSDLCQANSEESLE